MEKYGWDIKGLSAPEDYLLGSTNDNNNMEPTIINIILSDQQQCLLSTERRGSLVSYGDLVQNE